MRLRRLRELELAERFLELSAHTVERRVRVGRDHRTDELEREPDRTRLERCQPRGQTERVAVQLLVDAHRVALELRVDGVAAAAEVDEVEELQVLLELLLRNAEALDEFPGGDDRVATLAARSEQVGEQRLQDGEALGHDRPRRTLGDVGVV